jgi:hypothetical protein
MMHRKTNQDGGPPPLPASPWLAGAAIGLTILGMASTAMAFGAGLAWTRTAGGGK